MNTEKLKIWIPTLLSLIFANIIPWVAIGLNFMIWEGYFDTQNYFFPYSDLSILTTVLITIILIIFLWVVSRRINKPNSLTIPEAFSKTINLIGTHVSIGYALLLIIYVIVNLPFLEDTTPQDKTIWMYYTVSVFILYLALSIAASFFYAFSLAQHKSEASKRLFWSYATLVLIFLVFVDYFINNFNPKSTSLGCLALNLIYLFVIVGTTHLVNLYLSKEKNKSLEKSLTSLWIIILIFIGINKILPSQHSEYVALLNTLFMPVTVGFIFNALLIAIHKDVKQDEFKLIICKKTNPERPFHTIIDSVLSLIFNLIINLPSYVIHSVTLCLFDLKTAEQKQLQKKSRLVSRLESRKQK